MSSCRSASYSSGPLVSGQTRISRSLGSMRVASTALGVSSAIVVLLLQGRLGAFVALGQFDVGDGDERLGAALQVGRFQEGLLLARSEGTHHAQRVDERLVGRLLDPAPIHLDVVGIDEVAQ